MKRLKFVLPILAFLTAIIGAFASSLLPRQIVTGSKFRNANNQCVNCFTANPNCATTGTIVCECVDVSGPSGSLVPTFQTSLCSPPLYKP